MTHAFSNSAGRRALTGGAAALAVALSLVFAAGALGEPPRVPAAEASGHVGEVATVCGRVASAAYFASVKGGPTFLNIGRPYPDQPFTAVIWGSSRSRFEGAPERLYDGKEICVTGTIELYRGKPQIVVEEPGQIVTLTPKGGGGDLDDLERIFVKAVLASFSYEVNYGSAEWDSETQRALVTFQEDHDIEPTGEPDAATLRALAAAVPDVQADDLALIIRLLLFEIARREE
jgi:hypothetical protein